MFAEGGSRGMINQRVGRVVRAFKWGVSCEVVPPEAHQVLRALTGPQRGLTAATEPEPVRPVDEGVLVKVIDKTPPVVAFLLRLTTNELFGGSG